MLRVRPGRMGEAFDPADERLFLRPSPFALRASVAPAPVELCSDLEFFALSSGRKGLNAICLSVDLAGAAHETQVSAAEQAA